MPDKPWKRCERALAKRLGGRRLGATGRRGPDIVNDWVSAEVKTRKRLPRWLVEALEQARAGVTDDRLPLAILHETGQRHDSDLVVMALRDFCDWFGPLDAEDGA